MLNACLSIKRTGDFTMDSFSNSALHFGIAFGSFIGGIVIEHTSAQHNATVGAILVLLALGAALISMHAPKQPVKEQFEN